MKELKSFLERMGGLHDAVVHQLVWIPDAKMLRIEILDLCSNFEGLPEYPGAISGAIELKEIDRLSFAIDTDEKQLRIHEFLVEGESADRYRASISFWPSGRIDASCHAATFPQVTLRNAKN